MGAISQTLDLDIGGSVISILLRRSTQARRISLRVDPAMGAVMVLPARAALKDAQRFAVEHRIWLAERLARLPGRVDFVPGAAVPVLGVDHSIHHEPDARRGVWIEDQAIRVSGRLEFVPRRVADFLKAEARRLVSPRAADLAARVDRPLGRVSVKDTRSRWGSCSAAGDLAFSWRLVMAPEWVLDYVVAHEVAHLVELNHSPAFWSVVSGLSSDHARARSWLKKFGAALHRYG